MFSDRSEAGSLLAARLQKHLGQPCVILAVPGGGVPVAYEVAKQMGMPLDILLTKMIGHPVNREQIIGTVSLTNFFINPYRGISQSYINREILTKQKRLTEMYRKFTGDTEPESLEGKTVILIDDGIVMSNNLQAIVNVLRNENPAKIIIAAPVAVKSAVEKLAKTADELIGLLIIDEVHGIGDFYKDFDEVNDEEVIYFLDKWRRELKKTG